MRAAATWAARLLGAVLIACTLPVLALLVTIQVFNDQQEQDY